ncbi:FAD-dependent oxidoreductase [Streptomyces sp. NPDC048172]|uniref:FAD-dependent oxidoreductase n=1 Tax=Streptomyces sp. NPDC048172 TaxID=3365505 RepID=UPI003723E8D0
MTPPREDLDHDVVVAGGGPVGLMLACELRLGGARVVVLERRTDIDPTLKAGGINQTTAEALYRRGLLPRAAEAQERRLAEYGKVLAAHGGGKLTVPPKFAGHFAGIPLRGDLMDTTDPDFDGAGPAGEVGAVLQQDVERILGEHAEELGVDVRRGVELTGFEAEADGVGVRTSAGSLRAGWLVGCDGGRSLVRKHAGFAFPGTDPEITGRQAVVEMTGTEGLRYGWNRTEHGTYAFGPMPGRFLTVEFDGPPADREAPVTREELEKSLRRVSGADVRIQEVHSATRFTDNARQADRYRAGRVLLAGDAAHVHSPFGGQGLNLGVGDAMNLGWKLAAVVRGEAPDTLLDTYTAERHPLGDWVLRWTRAQVALMRTDSHASALRDVVAELMETVTATTFLVKKISGVWHRYELPGPEHPLTGRSAPDLALADGSRLADHLHGGHGLLLDLAGDAAVTDVAHGYAGRVDTLTVPGATPEETAALLVRPDGVVAWATDEPADAEGLEEALSTWFGAAA